MCNKAINIYVFAIQLVHDCYRTQEVCVTAVDTCPFIFDCFWSIRIQAMSNKVVSEDPFILKHCLVRYKTQEMCDKAADSFLPPLKFVRQIKNLMILYSLML